MRIRTIIITASVFVLAACATSTMNAAETEIIATTEFNNTADYYSATCGADIQEHCPTVMPGDGRVASCLYAHQDLISKACFIATEQTGVILEGLFDRLNKFYSVCSVDLIEQCSDQEAIGDKFTCLADKTDTISADCAEALPAYVKK